MMATAAFDHPPPPQSLLLYPTLIDQTSLSDLAPLVRNRNYHAYRDAVTRTQLDQSILANALIARLTTLLYYAHTLLVRPVVNAGSTGDNTGDFSVLNQVTQELQEAVISKCTAPAEPVVQPVLSLKGSSTRFSTTTSFFDELSPTASNTLVNFLGIIRADPYFLSNRLLQAKDQELDSLVSWKPRHHIARSKLVSSGRHTEAPVAPISPADYISSFHRHDPMYVLTSVIFSASPNSSSLEYSRRMNSWSTCLARLIDEKRGDRIVLTAMDIFCTGGWQVSSCFETILLGFLQNAAKLSSANPKYEDECEEAAMETDPEMAELFDKTLVEILRLVNDSGGIPSFALELINAISVKCTDQDQARSVLFTKWFIEHFLSRSIIYPEYRGLLNECFISDDQRLLLQSLYSRLEKHCTSMLRQPAYEPEDEHLIHMHIDALMEKFFRRDPCHQTTGDDMCGKSPQPAIVLCPSDVLTAFYALYPKHRPKQSLQMPSTTKHARKLSDESAKSSEVIRLSSDLIRPILKKSHMFDLHDGSTSSQSEAEHTTSEPDSPAVAENEDVDMYGLSVKAAVDEMRRRLGPDCCSGERHPCDDMWATLYISMDGSSLSCIPDFELIEVSNHVQQPIVGRDEDVIIEEALLKIEGRISKAGKPKQVPVESQVSPYRFKDCVLEEDLILLIEPYIQSSHTPPTPVAANSSLLSSLQLATKTSFARGDYIEGQSFQQAYDVFKSISSPQLTSNDYAPIVGSIARRIQKEGNTYLNLVRTREVCFSYLLEDRQCLEECLSKINTTLSQLRCKTWYTNHVRQSKVWQRAKDVCQALHKMKSSRSGTTSSAPISNLKRNTSALSLNRSNSMTKQESRRFLPSRQSFDGFSFSGRPASLYNVSFGTASDDWFDILPATSEQGGPHKLSDYQIDVTNLWLTEHASENFCRGEEIIHRFIAEVDDVARRLVPDSADEMSVVASTFWEREEFEEEAKEFGLIELDGRKDEYSTGRRSEEIPRNSSSVDIFGLLGRSRGKTICAETSDTRSIRSTHSRTASLSVNTRALPDVFVRPSSSHSVSFPPPSPAPSLFSRHSNLTIPMTRSATNVDEKGANKFLEVTKQRLLSLLLSDLGMEMWSAGSETDEWFTDGLADACLDRKRQGRKKPTTRTVRKDKKLSVVPGSKKPPVRHFSLDVDGSLPTPPLSRESSGDGSENISIVSAPSESSLCGFDFTTAYKQLLTKFSVHPAPHEKLNALFELERLMTASFTNTCGEVTSNTFRGRTHFPPTPQTSPESIRRVSDSSAVGTDDLIDEIQRVLRDPRLRPKTLFRDLAFISAFVPPLTLTHHGEGKVFWDIGLAASAMKADVVNAMVDWYEEIMAGNERVSARRGERDSRSHSASIGKIQDGARMLVIAACEGNAVGQRELALLHLSHPSLLPLTTLPLTRPSDTFQKVSLKDVVGDKDKYDPDRIALATHWFRLAAKNGDKYAQNVEGNWLGSRT